jgi:hypothetical protein
MRPDARRDQLVVQETGDGLVVYDLQRHRVHHLNGVAAQVWQCCNGRRSPAELAGLLETGLDAAAGEAVVWQALDRLGKAHLLKDPVQRPAGSTGLSRRQMLRKLGKTAAAALLVPMIWSITAPTPAWAEGGCDVDPCLTACADQCQTNADCPTATPVCKLLQCKTSGCLNCLQMRCAQAASGGGGGGPP